MTRAHHLLLPLLLCVAGCVEPPLGMPCVNPEDCIIGQTNQWFTDSERNVDILFLIDNSPSMSPKQRALAENIRRFIEIIDGSGYNYHVGIATSDTGQCADIPGIRLPGDDGLLQVTPCTQRPLGGEALAACRSLCPDDRYVPMDGKRYIAKVDGRTNVPQKLVGGKDVGPQEAFKCMALIGDYGCGLESQLEGARRALERARDDKDANAGFLRKNSLLAVIFISDEDDCSAAAARKVELAENWLGEGCEGETSPRLSCYNADFRCMAGSIECDQPLSTPGEKRGCREKPARASLLEPVERYVSFLSSLRPSQKLLIAGVWTLPSLGAEGGRFQVVARGISDGDTVTRGISRLNRADRREAVCFNPKSQDFFGLPQLRLSKFADSIPGSRQRNVCDDSYEDVLRDLAQAIVGRSPCLSERPKGTACLVGDVDSTTPDAAPDVRFPLCSSSCCDAWAAARVPSSEDPGVRAACAAEPADACYCLVNQPRDVCESGAMIGIYRNQPQPAGKVVNVRCAVGK